MSRRTQGKTKAYKMAHSGVSSKEGTAPAGTRLPFATHGSAAKAPVPPATHGSAPDKSMPAAIKHGSAPDRSVDYNKKFGGSA